MKNFLKNNGLWVLFAAAVIAVALALMSVFSNTSSPLVNLANTIASPFRSAYTAVAEGFNDKQKYYQDYTALEEENAELKRQIAQMEADIRQAQLDSAENARLEALLGLLPALEERGMLSDVSSVELGDTQIQLRYLGRYNVKMPLNEDFSYNLGLLQTVVEDNTEKYGEQSSGTMDLTQEQYDVVFSPD